MGTSGGLKWREKGEKVMHWVIDPKLKVISNEYEKRQLEYIDELERKARWEAEHNG